MTLRVKLLRPGAKFDAPRKPGDVGYDLSACIDGDVLIQAGETKVIGTGVAIRLPPGHEGQVRPRSGLARDGIVAELGTIDGDYVGEIGVILHNRSGSAYVVEHGHRIAQLVIAPVALPAVHFVGELGATVRGESGFGSSGVA